MGKIVFSDGGEYHRPGRPHLFEPGLRAAAHYLKAVEEVDPGVRRKLIEEVLGRHPFPRHFVDWQGLVLTRESIGLDPIPGQSVELQEQRFELARPCLEALQSWANEYYMWSPFILELLYKILKLWDDLDREIYECEVPRIRTADGVEIEPPLSDEDERFVETLRTRKEFLEGEREAGWGWWVDFLTSDITVLQLDAWLAGHGLCLPSVPGTRLLNMPSSPSKAALWIYERLKCATSKTYGVLSLSEHDRELLKRWDRLHIAIGWEPGVLAPDFRLVIEGWRPEQETWAAAKARLESGFKQALKRYRIAIEKRLGSGQLHPRPKDSEHVKWGEPHRWEATPTKYCDEHFEWLALRQVTGLRPHEIASRPGNYRTVSTVNEAIEGTARLLHLELRPVRPGPPSVLGD